MVSDFRESWNRILGVFSYKIGVENRKSQDGDFKNRNPIPTFLEIRDHKEWPKTVPYVGVVAELADPPRPGRA